MTTEFATCRVGTPKPEKARSGPGESAITIVRISLTNGDLPVNPRSWSAPNQYRIPFVWIAARDLWPSTRPVYNDLAAYQSIG